MLSAAFRSQKLKRAVAAVCATATQISKRSVNGDVVPCFGTVVVVPVFSI